MYLARTSLQCMLSKSFEKYINSLKHKKYRQQHQRFIAEGEKASSELIKEKFPVEKIFALAEWIESNKAIAETYKEKIIPVNQQEMKRISGFITPSPVLIVGEIPDTQPDQKSIASKFNLVLDGIQDPGNLGTIIRIADWFDIPHVFCSPDCADPWNEKTIHASMGSIARITTTEIPPDILFGKFPDLPVYGAFPEGENLFTIKFPLSGFILIGNEARGISSSLLPFIKQRITISRKGKAESLNAAIAAGIVCAWLKK